MGQKVEWNEDVMGASTHAFFYPPLSIIILPTIYFTSFLYEAILIVPTCYDSSLCEYSAC